jgi:hypothetical protein
VDDGFGLGSLCGRVAHYRLIPDGLSARLTGRVGQSYCTTHLNPKGDFHFLVAGRWASGHLRSTIPPTSALPRGQQQPTLKGGSNALPPESSLPCKRSIVWVARFNHIWVRQMRFINSLRNSPYVKHLIQDSAQNCPSWHGLTFRPRASKTSPIRRYVRSWRLANAHAAEQGNRPSTNAALASTARSSGKWSAARTTR